MRNRKICPLSVVLYIILAKVKTIFYSRQQRIIKAVNVGLNNAPHTF